MRILQINNFHYLKGGVETVYLGTIDLLRSKGHYVIPFSIKDMESISTEFNKYFVDDHFYAQKGFLKKILNINKFFFLKESGRNLQKLIDDEKPDIAHLHIFYGRLTSSILDVLKRNHIPIVMTVHEYKMLCPAYVLYDINGKVCEKCATRNYQWCVIKRCTRGNILYSLISTLESFYRDRYFPYDKYIDKFIMPSRFILNKHIEYRPDMKNKAEWINNFVENKNYNPDYAPGDYYIYFGRLSREKGLLTLLKAWKNFPGLQLKIVGMGDEQTRINNYLEIHKMKNVSLPGFFKGEELKDMIRKARFVIVPSEWYENNPMVVLESFSLGKPVIGADIGGIPELITPGKNGYVFRTGDVNSLIEVLDKASSMDSGSIIKMGEDARRVAISAFSDEIYYKKLNKLYLSCINLGK